MFGALLIGHLIGDWLVQTDRQAMNKMKSWKANQAHVATYHLSIAATVALGTLATPALFYPHITPLAAGLLLVSWPTHSLLDRRWPVRWLMEHTGSSGFASTSFGPMVVDQVLHIVTLWAIATAVAGI